MSGFMSFKLPSKLFNSNAFVMLIESCDNHLRVFCKILMLTSSDELNLATWELLFNEDSNC